MGQILKRNLKSIGIEVEIKQFPGTLFKELATPGEPFDIGRVRWFSGPDPAGLLPLFDGRTIGRPGNQNWSYFNSPKVNRLLDVAARLTGSERNRAYGDLDVLLSEDLAPAIPVSIVNAPTFVSARVGCIALNPWLDLTAVCLK
jgi:ABC-type transport system substrate-binding protein